MSDQKRSYRMSRRAELEEETRLRITQSTVALHEELGPARTSISAIAERAGVRRSTVYRHFPDESALLMACSAHWRAANPSPDPAVWADMADPARRTETALTELYAYYGRTDGMYASLFRDEPVNPAVRRQLRGFHDYMRGIEDALMAGRGLRGRPARRTRAAIGHALGFSTWRSLTREQGLSDADAVRMMCRLVDAAGSDMGSEARLPRRPARPSGQRHGDDVGAGPGQPDRPPP